MNNIGKEQKTHIKTLADKLRVVPHLQPIVDRNNNIFGYECLLRCEIDGNFKNVINTPLYNNAIPIFHNKVFELLKTAKEKNVKLFLNFSLSKDVKKTIFRNFLRLVFKYRDYLDHLVIEIIEDNNNFKKDVIKYIQYAKRMGIQFALDDFGTKNSNFDRLFTYPIDYLKIDGEIIKNISDHKHKCTVRFITQLCKENNIKVIAEFIENEEIYKKTFKKEVDFFQGFHFSLPKPHFHFI